VGRKENRTKKKNWAIRDGGEGGVGATLPKKLNRKKKGRDGQGGGERWGRNKEKKRRAKPKLPVVTRGAQQTRVPSKSGTKIPSGSKKRDEEFMGKKPQGQTGGAELLSRRRQDNKAVLKKSRKKREGLKGRRTQPKKITEEHAGP